MLCPGVLERVIYVIQVLGLPGKFQGNVLICVAGSLKPQVLSVGHQA